MQSVASGDLCHLQTLHESVTGERYSQRRRRQQSIFHHCGFHSEAASRDLHNGTVRATVKPNRQRGSYYAFATDNTNFHTPSIAGQHHQRSEEHTSELQSPCNLVCRLLLEKK